MTRVSRNFSDTVEKEALPAVSADVIFASSRFPNYKIGANNHIVNVKGDPKVLSMKEIVARETALLLEQQNRLSVRDLANKFEKGLAAAAKLSEEVKSFQKSKELKIGCSRLLARLREAASLEKHVLLKKLRDALESLKGRVAGRNKDDVEEAIAMVEALAVQLTQREGELIQEKTEVKKLATFLKQASEDAKKLVDEERAFARAEIENARAAVQRVEEALQEKEQMSRASGKQDLEELMKEVQEARRIKMLHQPSKVMDMEHELRALRVQLAEKSKHSLLLQKEARKSVYAPEPFDVGRILQVEIIYDGQLIMLTTTGAIDPAAGLGNYVEALVRKHDVEFNRSSVEFRAPAASRTSHPTSFSDASVGCLVVVTQMNGVDQPSESIHVLHVGKMRMKLCKGKATIAKEYYSGLMQLARSKRVKENLSHLYELDGAEVLGSYLRIKPCSDIAPELSKCAIQWYRISSEGGKKELISGKDGH
ncbi:hypothetical protein GOBAR_DD36690 [Gossypium barbadense]|nr:hypothetical protein GOBAR_DD36690 [Gossypium barbadense]